MSTYRKTPKPVDIDLVTVLEGLVNGAITSRALKDSMPALSFTQIGGTVYYQITGILGESR